MVNSNKFCKFCGSTDLIQWVGEDEPTVHYGRIFCGECDRHIRWLPDPAVTDEHDKRKLLMKDLLYVVVGWEKLFLTSIYDRRWLTSKQQQKFSEICDRHAHKINCAPTEVRARRLC